MAITDAQKLLIYNGALTEMGERKLSALTDSVESRRVLDTIWDDDFIEEVLQAGYWNFAVRTALIDEDTDIDSEFGYGYAFSKPSDWVRTVVISEHEDFHMPLNDIVDEAGYWWSHSDQIYAKWISNGDNYGGDYSKWPPDFKYFVKCRLAYRAAKRLTQDREKLAFLKRELKDALLAAKNSDAMNEPVKFAPAGEWVRSRHGGSRLGRERRGS